MVQTFSFDSPTWLCATFSDILSSCIISACFYFKVQEAHKNTPVLSLFAVKVGGNLTTLKQSMATLFRPIHIYKCIESQQGPRKVQDCVLVVSSDLALLSHSDPRENMKTFYMKVNVFIFIISYVYQSITVKGTSWYRWSFCTAYVLRWLTKILVLYGAGVSNRRTIVRFRTQTSIYYI